MLTIFIVLALCGCDAGTAATDPTTAPATTAPTMNFTVEEVFYIKPPVDRGILVGTINEGTVRVGDKLVVHTSAGAVNVAVDNIESIQQGDLKQASKGQQVGLRLTGIRKDQPSKGDRVTAAGGA
jgi:translation elongation factor EF-1alpha